MLKWEQKVYAKSLYLLFIFAVNLIKTAVKKKSLWKKRKKEQERKVKEKERRKKKEKEGEKEGGREGSR